MNRLMIVLLCCCSASLVGCNRGPVLGTVKGTITIDGQPVDGGIVRFVPAAGESQPADSRVTAGAYSVTMPIGEKKVEIFWAKSTSGQPIDTASQGNEQLVQMIPPKYNAQTTLTYNIVAGEQVKDFSLTSK
jgi:hypothetical protein